MAFAATDLLAGPVVRRVTTASVAVWAIARRPARVALRVFRDDDGLDLAGAVELDTVAIGAELHAVLAFLELAPGQRLEPGRAYGYDLLFDGSGLGALGLLRDGAVDGHRHLALGYAPDKLPTFLVPPASADALVIAHGSCRRPYASGLDGLVALDQRLERARLPGGAVRRPHLMCHTGDQIYADDLSPELLTWMSDLAIALIGRDGAGRPIERIRVDLPDEPTAVEFPVDRRHFPPGRRQRLMVRACGFTSGDGESHTFGLGEYVAQYLMAWCNLGWPRLDDDATWRRLHAERGALVRDFLTAWIPQYREARFFVNEGRSAPGNLDQRVAYLEAWRLVPRESRALDQVGRDAADEAAEWNADGPDGWQAFWDGIADQPRVPPTSAAVGATSGVARSELVGTDAQLRKLAGLTIPAWYAGAHHVRIDVAHRLGRDDTPASADAVAIATDQVLSHLAALRRFYQGLPYARRALANVSNLMMFDDHEVTDDWNISREWVARVRGKAMGRDVISNGLVAYALCQDWGNAPERYLPEREEPARARGANRDVLEAACLMFHDSPGGPLRASGPPLAQRRALERAFALDGGAGTAVWDYQITDAAIAPYEIISLDNRTRRGFDTLRASPANITDESMVAQIHAQPPAGSRVTVVIAPLPPLGFPPLEQVGQPYLNLLHDYQKNPAHEDVLRRQALPAIERDYLFGRLIKDPEPWGFHPHALEHLLARLTSRRAVLFLSGDVHYALTGKMTYWKRGAANRLEPATRFVQLTSSGLLNQTGAGEILLAHLGLAQQFGAVVTGPYDRLGWAAAGAGGPTLPSSTTLSRHVTRLLQQEPVLIPTRALPDDVLASLRAGTLPVPPEWAWRLEQVKDLRLDDDRYQALAGAGQAWRLPTEAELADPVQGARKIANHHDWHTRNGAPRRFLMTSNLCVVELAATASGGLETVHAMHSWDRSGVGPAGAGAPPVGVPWPDARLAAQPYTLHRISLDPTDELAPDREAPP